MINADDEDDEDPIHPFKRSGLNPYEQQTDDSRQYRFNPTMETPLPSSDILQDVSTPNFAHKLAFAVSDKETNTEATISHSRPKDFSRGVWPSKNAFGGVTYRPKIVPKMVSHYVQVESHEIDESRIVPQVVYQIVAPASAIPPKNIRPRMIQTSDDEESIVEIVEKPPKRQLPQKQKIIVKQSSGEHDVTSDEEPKSIERVPKGKKIQRIEYFDSDEEKSNRAEPIDVKHKRPYRIEYVDTKEERSNRVEHVDAKEERPHRVVKQPQYEIVEDVIERANSSSIEDITDAMKHEKKRGKKKNKKQGFGKISVKHIKPNK